MTDFADENAIGKLDVSLELAGCEAIARRRTGFLPDGAYFFEDKLEIGGVLPDATVITSAAWLIEFYELKTGEIFFTRGTEQIRAQQKRFAVFYPPFSIARLTFNFVQARLFGIAATDELSAEFLSVPLLLAVEKQAQSVADVAQILTSNPNSQSIEINPQASQLSRKAKKLIDENYAINLSLARAAEKLKVSPAHLSRQFKRDFGFSPSVYLHQLRTSDAVFRLAKGEPVIDLSQDVGYNDLSRFYKQFRKNTRHSPKSCQLPKIAGK